MANSKSFLAVATSTILLGTALTLSVPSQAGDAGAFVGGMMAGRVMHNMHERTQAEKAQAYYAQQEAQAAQQQAQQQPVQQAAPAQSPGDSTQQKLEELDKLAAGGYITPEEYKAKRKSIIDAM
jgi:hypothetical protein